MALLLPAAAGEQPRPRGGSATRRPVQVPLFLRGAMRTMQHGFHGSFGRNGMRGLSPLRTPLLAAALACLLLARPAPAADWPVARGPSREPAPFRYDPALWK